jgi:hypothetical protein
MVRGNRFEAYVASNDLFQLSSPIAAECEEVSERPIVIAARRHQANANINVAIWLRGAVGAAAEQP